MAYGTEVMIPLEISLPNTRTTNYSFDENERLKAKQLDFIEKKLEIAAIQLANFQQKSSRGYNWNVRLRKFVAGDLVL